MKRELHSSVAALTWKFTAGTKKSINNSATRGGQRLDRWPAPSFVESQLAERMNLALDSDFSANPGEACGFRSPSKLGSYGLGLTSIIFCKPLVWLSLRH